MEKVILITGCSTGIGRETALLFARKGWKVIATMRRPEREKEMVDIKQIDLCKMDVTSEKEIDKVIQQSIEKYGKIDVIVNNAGIGVFGAFEAADQEMIQKQYDTNVFGPMRVIRAILPHFRSRKEGLIINVSSGAGKLALPCQSLYDSTKYAIEGFSEALLYELEPFGIRIKLVLPGNIKTAFFNSLITTDTEKLNDYKDYQQQVLDNHVKMNNIGAKPVIVAEVIYKAACDKSNKVRYLAGSDAKLFVTVRKFAPDRVFFHMVRNRVNYKKS